MIEIQPSNFAAPRHRPAGMDPSVPYQPMLDSRNGFKDWWTRTGIKAWYATPLHEWTPRIVDLFTKGETGPVLGTPGTPVADRPNAYKVAVIGDMGEGSAAEVRNAANMLAWKPTHVATVGDNVYPLGRETDWANRFDPQFAEVRKHTTWFPALGNHDYYNADLTPYFDRFQHIKGQAYYSWNLGPAQFFVLDSEQRLDGGSAQQAWLSAELAKSDAKYKVLQMHRPMVSSSAGSNGRAMYGSLGPLLAQHGVQLVLQGHDHAYERSKELDGTTFVVGGGGGAAVYDHRGALPEHTQVRSSRHHHLQLSFDDTQMVLRAVDDRGRVFDTTTFKPNAAAVDAAQAAGTLAPAPVAA